MQYIKKEDGLIYKISTNEELVNSENLINQINDLQNVIVDLTTTIDELAIELKKIQELEKQ